jgi:hypothetical protein
LQCLDLFLHLPTEATQFSDELIQNAMGTISPPDLNVKGTKLVASLMADMVSAAQKRPLRTLNLHFGRTGYQDRGQAYLLAAKMQLRRSERDDADVMGEGKYECVHYCWNNWHAGREQEMLELERPW